MPKLTILADSELAFVQDYFGTLGELRLKPGRLIENADLLDVDLLLVRSVTRVDEALLKGTAVKWVGTVTAGLDHLDLAWLDQAGILWRSAAGYNAEPVSDYVMTVLALLENENDLPLQARRFGILGVGQVGGRVAKRLKSLGLEVMLYDPPRAAREKTFSSCSWAELSACDFVTVHCDLTHTGLYPSYHLINDRFWNAERVFVNTSRGAVVDSAALKKVCDRTVYCFDVWEEEPEVDRKILQAAWLATPHLAGHSVQSRYRGTAMLYQAFSELGLFEAKAESAPFLPRKTFSFKNQYLTWQEVLLALFDPALVTAEMKEKLLLKGTSKCATLFDQLRRSYIGEKIRRHEFAFTTITDLQLSEEDRFVLTQFGITIEE